MASASRLLKKLWKRNGDSAQKNRLKPSRLAFEALESRELLTLIGVTPEFPLIVFNNDGTVNYNAAADSFDLDATPLAFRAAPTDPPRLINGARDFRINIEVDGAGNLVGGVPGDDLIVTGDLDIDGNGSTDFSGTLLTGEVTQFGFQNSSGTTDLYDFIFTPTGGALVGLFAGKDIGVTTTSERSSFTGSFGVNFSGEAKGTLGAVEPTGEPGIDLEKLTNGVDADDEADAPLIAPGDLVTWTYKVTNTGDLPFTFTEIEIVDDAGTPGDTSDDFSTTSGDIVFDAASDVGSDGILSPGEMWFYEASAIAEDLADVGTPVTIDLDTDGLGTPLAAGTIIDDEYANFGLTITTSDPVNHPAMIFDSSNPTGGDTDLGTPNQDFGGPGIGTGGEAGMPGENNTALGNVLIISEDGDSSDPDDDAGGGTIIFTWDEPVSVDEVEILDIDNEPGGTIVTFDSGGSMISTSPILDLGNNSFQTVAIGDSNVARMEVIFPSSGAVTNLVFSQIERGCYENHAVVSTGPGGPTDEDPSHYCNPDPDPGIDLEKLTNGVDADDESDAPLIAPGDLVTWTYKVTNTGNIPFDFAEVEIVDDAGTPGDASDDFSTTSGDIVFDPASDVGSDGILSPGEMWIYEASETAQDLVTGGGATTTFVLTGSSALDGPNGNIRTFSADGISVNASAFSRTTGGTWTEAFLGSYSSGLGVTDSSEGDGTGGTHRVDNVGQINYVLFEFSETVIVDQAFLASVVNDSDISVWIGTVADPFNNHLTLSDAVLSGLGLNEVNNTGSSSSRWADFNAGALAGNVLVLAASTEDSTPEDRFKIKKVKVQPLETGCYENHAVVSTGSGGPTDEDPSHYCNPDVDPGIDIEKLTNGVNADDEADAPLIAPGDLVTWTYQVTNTGNMPFDFAEVEIVDDAGTPGDPGDDFSTTSGDIVFDASSDDGSDGILSPGEMWIYEASDTAQDLGTASDGTTTTFVLTGSSGLDGTDGNIRTFSSNGISVNASAFSRTTGGTWDEAFLGSFSSGLGVTDSAEGSGGNGMHRVDNVNRLNFVLFEFSETVVVDEALLASVVNDSDLSIWIGTVADPFNNHLTLSDAVLAGLGLNEVDNTSSSSSRWADFNDGQVTGNVLVLAASTVDSTPEDRFKIKKVKVQPVEAGCYENLARVSTGQGGAMDTDLSHYCNPTDQAFAELAGLSAASAGPTTLVFEAENFTTIDHGWDVFEDPNGTGGGYLGTDNGTGTFYNSAPDGLEVTYDFTLTEDGQYQVLGLVDAASGRDNSFWIAIDDGEWVEWHLTLTDDFEWQVVSDGSGHEQALFDLAAGDHTLKIKVREDGTMLDKIAITNDVNLDPSTL